MKHTKRILCVILLALVLVAQMAMPVFAAVKNDGTTPQDGSLTVTGLDSNTVVKGYPIVSYNSATQSWQLTPLATSAGLTATDLANLTDESKSNGSDIAAALTKVAEYVKTNANNAAGETFTNTNGTAVLANPAVTPGAYLVMCSDDDKVFTNMYMNNYDAEEVGGSNIKDVTATAKGIDKEVLDSKVSYQKQTSGGNTTLVPQDNFAVGETATFVVSGDEFPDFRGDSKPGFAIVDTMSSGLELANPANIEVKINNVAVPAASYTITNIPATGTPTGFRIVFDSAYLVNNAAANAGQPFTVSYDAKVASYANDGVYTNTATPYVVTDEVRDPDADDDYDPDDPNTYPDDSEEDPVTDDVYTAAIQIRNVDGTTPLEGADFVVKNGDKFVNVANDGTVTLVDNAANATPFTTGSDGKTIEIKGLDPDLTYTVVQTDGADGYPTEATTATVTIAPNSPADGLWDGNVTPSSGNAWSNDGNNSDVPVVKVLLSSSPFPTLPITGGIGVYAIIIGGIILMICFGVGIMNSRKKYE